MIQIALSPSEVAENTSMDFADSQGGKKYFAGVITRYIFPHLYRKSLYQQNFCTRKVERKNRFYRTLNV